MPPGDGMKVSRVLGVDAALDGMAGEGDVALLQGERHARRRRGSAR